MIYVEFIRVTLGKCSCKEEAVSIENEYNISGSLVTLYQDF